VVFVDERLDLAIVKPMPFAQASTAPVSSASGALGFAAKSARFVILGALLVGELTHFGLPVLYQFSPSLHGWWFPALWNARPIVEAALGAVIATIFFSWQDFVPAVRAAVSEPASSGRIWWFIAHVVCALGVLGWMMLGTSTFEFSRISGELWFFGGVALFFAAVTTWCLALFPLEFWSNWFERNRGAFAAGAAVGVLTRLIGYLTGVLLYPLQHYTLMTVAVMLYLSGNNPVANPDLGLVGTSKFSVEIAPACSGLEGIGLLCAFLFAYMWYFRAELRFPSALALIPIGIVVIWISNALRITFLILLGQHLERAALEGFHSVAGWIFFNATAIGLIVLSRRMRLFSRIRPDDLHAHSNPAAPYLVPLAIMSAIALLTVPFSHGLDLAYPVRLIVTGAAIWWYRDRLRSILWGFSWSAAAIGAVVFVMWILLVTRSESAQSNAAFAANLRGISLVAACVWMFSRVAGAVVLSPVVEELAFRGYLLRKLSTPDFEHEPYQSITVPAFLMSSILFGILHQHYVAGILAGMIFAAAACYRGKLSDAVCAHSTSNAMLALYVIATGSWSLWN
jgi:exosortase E/protease (VPEID-CTERM system)